MDCLIKVGEKVAVWIANWVWRQIEYGRKYGSNISTLESELAKLKSIKSGVLRQVDVDKKNFGIILPAVEHWLAAVDTITADVESLLEDRAEVESGCCYGWCPSLKVCYPRNNISEETIPLLQPRPEAENPRNNISEEITPHLQPRPEAERGCCYGWCPNINIKSRYSLSKRSQEITPAVIDLQYKGNFHGIVSYLASPSEIGLMPSNSAEQFDSRKEKEEEVMAALRDHSVTIIGICGMGGIGKTTLAEKIRQRVTQEKVFDKAVLVKVSKKALQEIQAEIAGEIGLKLQGNNELSRKEQLCLKLMGERSVLVILDNVWEDPNLEELGIPGGNNHNHRCKVILTTRIQGICNSMDSKIVEVGKLDDNEASTLFSQIVGNSVHDPSLLDIAEAVVKECKGLPLAIINVAGALKGKRYRSWVDALAKLRRPTGRIPQVIRDVYQHLKLSYDHLESDESDESYEARHLFLLCSLFEEDSDIWTEDLLRYGMGLGIFSGIKNLEEGRNRVCSLLETLIDHFLISKGSGKNHVKMHDLIRDVAIYIASEGRNVFLVSHDRKSEEFPKITSDKQYSHISVVVDRFDELSEPISCPRLEFLMLKSNFDEFKLQDNFFVGMRELKVLSVSGLKVSGFHFPALFDSLSKLRMLSLSNLYLDDISIIGELINLEILSIIDSDLVVLPPEIGNLTNLIMLEIKIHQIPPGVLSRLVQLEELHVEGVETLSYSIMRELQSLSKLTALTLRR